MVDLITKSLTFSTFFIGEIVLIPYYQVVLIYDRAEARMKKFYRKN
jgi:hypothetical protein